MKIRNLLLTALLFAGLMSSCNSQNNVTVNGENVKLEDGIYAKIETNKGDILIKLATDKAPMTSANFIALAEGNMPGVSEEYKGKPFYDGLTFHRVIPNFMIQGGDPAGNGSGGPGYQFPNETSPDLKHDKGVISMANAGPNTNGSQFFITVAPTPNLDGHYSVFGKVVSGQAVADSISKVPRNAQDKPNEDVVMKKVTIIRKGKEAKNFDAPKVFEEGKQGFKKKQEQAQQSAMQTVDSISQGFETTSSGLRYKVLENGNGAQAKNGDKVEVHYKGMLPDGQVFDSSYKRGQPIAFTLGQHQVIPGWEEGIALLHVGDKARLVIPPDLAYGARGAGGVIPPNSWLIFDVELVSANAADSSK